MTLTNDLWTHGPRSSTATYKHLTLVVTSRYRNEESNGGLNDLLWNWRVSGIQGPDGTHATQSSLAIDRIGACVEAEEAAKHMANNMVTDDEDAQQ